MAQAFVTTSMDCYRWPPPQAREERYVPLYEKYYKQAPKGEDEWIEMKEDIGQNQFSDVSTEELKDIMLKLRKDRFKSTYTVEYCQGKEIRLKNRRNDSDDEEEKTEDKNIASAGPVEEQNSFESELLKQCINLYEFKKKRKLPPLSTFREVFGYSRPTRFYTKLSTYQYDYGEVGYHVLKGDYRKKVVETKDNDKDKTDNKPLKKPKRKKQKVCDKYERKSGKPIWANLKWEDC